MEEPRQEHLFLTAACATLFTVESPTKTENSVSVQLTQKVGTMRMDLMEKYDSKFSRKNVI